MRIRVLFHHEAADVPYVSEEFVEVPETATIQDLIQLSGHGEIADLSDYYPLSGTNSWGENYFPYLFVNGKAVYGVLFQDAKISDFLSTHNITDNTIRITIEFPLAGGLGAGELLEVWNNIYPTLEQIAVICTIAGFSLKGLFDYLKKQFIKKKQTPQVCFDIVLSRKRWNPHELSALLDITLDKAKELLKLCDYQYDKSQMQYIQGEHSEEIKEKLMNARLYD